MNADAGFDPDRPLPGPPTPWGSTSMPSSRSGPPYHMTEMIASEPALAERVLARLRGPVGPTTDLAMAIRDAAIAGEPIVVTGCGTSEHGALGVVEIVRESMRASGLPGVGPVSWQALEAALDPQQGGLLIGVSHEGATAATNRALEAGRAAGARVAVITVSGDSPAAALADIVIETGELDQSWCHTIGYLSPLLAATAVGAALRAGGALASSGEDEVAQAAAIRSLLAAGAGETGAAEAIAAAFADASHLVVIASGADRTAGRELTLKIEEAAWVPSSYRDLETFLHGHLPATDASTGLVLVLTDRAARSQRIVRARQALAAAHELGIRSAAIVASDAAAGLDSSLTPAGRIVVAEAPSLPAPIAALFGSATPLQLLTERIARDRGTNPDPIRRDDPAYRAAGEAGEHPES